MVADELASLAVHLSEDPNDHPNMIKANILSQMATALGDQLDNL